MCSGEATSIDYNAMKNENVWRMLKKFPCLCNSASLVWKVYTTQKQVKQKILVRHIQNLDILYLYQRVGRGLVYLTRSPIYLHFSALISFLLLNGLLHFNT